MKRLAVGLLIAVLGIAAAAGVAFASGSGSPSLQEGDTTEQQGWLGIHITDITERLLDHFHLTVESGVVITRVQPEGPADAAGLQAGDVIQAINGDAVENADQVSEAIRALSPGTVVTLTVLRGEKQSFGPLALKPGSGDLLKTFVNPTGTQSPDEFGWCLAAVGNKVVVGAPSADPDGVYDAGAAYLFDVNGTHLHKFENPCGDDDGQFGCSIAAVGDNLLIGESGGDVNGKNTGAAYLFHKTGTLLHLFTNPDPNERDNFGYSVAAMGNNVLIGAPEDDTTATDAGVVYLFEGGFILGDLQPDGDVDFADYAVLAGQWQQTPDSPSADIAPGGGDGIINGLDLKALCDKWLAGK